MAQETSSDGSFREVLLNVSFRRLYLGRIITNIGDSLYHVAAMWLIWELTGSTVYTGLVGALLQIPNILNFLVGPITDDLKLRPILLATQIINGLGVLIVPLAYYTGYLSVWIIIILMPILAFINNFVYPAQHAALPKILADDQLTKANSLFSSSFRAVNILSRAVGGGIIALIGAISLFLVNSATFAIAVLFFLGVRVPNTSDTSEDTAESEGSEEQGEDFLTRFRNNYLTDLRDGISYVRGSALSALLIGMMLNNFFVFAQISVLPAFADSFAGPTAYGILLGAEAAGSLVGASISSWFDELPISWVAIGSKGVSGVSLIAAVVVPEIWPTALLFGLASVPPAIFNVLYGSMYQNAVDNSFLGRVSSLTRTLSSVMMPAGALLGGIIAEQIGSPLLIFGAGVGTLLVGVYYLLNPQVRSIPSVTEASAKSLNLE